VLTLVPPVVVQDELRAGELKEYCSVPNLYEQFYAISVRRHYERPLVRQLIDRAATDFSLQKPWRQDKTAAK
jgi:LysR family transcriptional regulator, transcriptional activator of nhaA